MVAVGDFPDGGKGVVRDLFSGAGRLGGCFFVGLVINLVIGSVIGLIDWFSSVVGVLVGLVIGLLIGF